MYFLKRANTLLVFLLFFISSNLIAQNTEYLFNGNCIEAAKNISLLKLKTAAAILNQERINHPNNCAVDYLENYIDFYQLITSQDINELHKLEAKKSSRIQRIASLPASSPYRLYSQAEINLQWAFSRVLHQEYFTAAIEFRESYNLLEKNTDLFPFFNQNQKNKGMLLAMLGSIPENFKWVLNIIGMKGDFNQGMSLLENFVEHQAFTPELLLEKQTGQYYYTILQMNFGDKQKSWLYCEKVTRDFETNMLSTYLRSFVGIKTGHNEIAIDALMKRPINSEYTSFPYLDYLTGVALLNKLSPTCAVYFKKYVSFSKGKNLIKDAYKRLSWLELIEGDNEKFVIYQNMILEGEEDKVAQKEALNKYKPNIILLKARLLFDGGYYDKAFTEISHTIPINKAERLEYEYRFGRICGELKWQLKAIEHYQSCIANNDEDLHLHFAPSSALQLGIIYEQLGNKLKAVEYYKLTLSFKNYDYKFSTVTKAKQALQRLNTL